MKVSPCTCMTGPSWTGEVYETECYFPTWINKESAAHVQALVDAHHALWGDKRIGHADADHKRDAMHLREGRPLTDKWTFSTNGVSIQGRYGIPCVGFGPGAESPGSCPQRDHLEAGSGDLCRPVRRRARPCTSARTRLARS